jgi:hypothetical protein
LNFIDAERKCREYIVNLKAGLKKGAIIQNSEIIGTHVIKVIVGTGKHRKKDYGRGVYIMLTNFIIVEGEFQ